MILMQINHVGPVPSSYYVRDHVKVDYEYCMTVNRGSSQQLDYEILFPGCVLRWQFACEGADIGFGVFLKTKKDVLRFDNTYSIFQAKRVSYTVEVLLSDQLQSQREALTNGTNGKSSNNVQAEDEQSRL
ncbi:hypothetical protein GOODEAATRI_016559 [Goodea atripinnis]|uniref:Uncharacterized protein n=1 Tax=Goodea atripinnis TaxID=208336 RepID=A0ABV0PYM0_9TELE